MPIAGSWADDSPENFDTIEEVAQGVDTVANVLYATDGQLGAITMWWGPPIGPNGRRVDGPLRVDVWGETGHAAVRWDPTGEVGIDREAPGAETDMMVMESAYEPMVKVPAEVIRCTVESAKRAVVEYVQTGRRPACLDWRDANEAT